MTAGTITAPEPTTTPTYGIVVNAGLFYVTRNGTYLTDKNGVARAFASRNAARKRISRERRGSFHA